MDTDTDNDTVNEDIVERWISAHDPEDAEDTAVLYLEDGICKCCGVDFKL